MPARVKKVGWKRTSVAIKRASVRAQRMVKQSTEDFANEVKDKLVNGILEQTFRLAPLTRRYLLWKIAHGYDRRILIKTGAYLDSIIVTKYKAPRARLFKGVKSSIRLKAKRTAWFVGINKRTMVRRGVPMWKLANWLEFGTRRMVARPHWRPTAYWARHAWPARFGKGVRNYARRR